MKKVLGVLLMFALAASSANAQLLWKISGKGLEKPSYIFGTYHLSPIGIKDSIAAMPRAMEETEQVYGEVVMSDMKDPLKMAGAQSQMMMPADTTFKSLFTPDQYEKVAKMVKEYMNADLELLTQVKPTLISTQLAVLIYLKHTPGFNPNEGLDEYFQQQALARSKKVGGLETVMSQISIIFSGQSVQRQAHLLCCMVDNIDKATEQVKRLIAAYNAQDLDRMLKVMKESYSDSCDPLPGEMEMLIDNRNVAWMKQMPHIMEQAPTLFVVGAGHLPGNKGVLQLLKEQGYTLEPMK